MQHLDTVQSYSQTGWAKIRALASPDEVENLSNQLYGFIAEAHACGQRIAAFNKETGEHDRDPLFLDSGSSTTVFHEPSALGWTLPLSLDLYTEAVARVGHGLHTVDGAVRDWLTRSTVGALSRSTGRRSPGVIETVFVRKSVHSSELEPHLDDTYLSTSPPSVQVFWLSLDASSRENGGLFIDPRGPLLGSPTRLVKRHGQAEIIDVPENRAVSGQMPSTAECVQVDCAVGDAVLVDGLLAHGSAKPSASGQEVRRDALAIHVVDLECEWSRENYLGNVQPLAL